MQSGQVTALKVEDVTLYAKMSWGRKKKVDAEVAAVMEQEDKSPLVPILERELSECVVRVEGLTDDQGTPITALTPEVIADLPHPFVMAAWKELMSSGEAVRA